MKNLRFLLAGVLCICAIVTASFCKHAKADGLKPIDTSSDPTPVEMCTCTCQAFTVGTALPRLDPITGKYTADISYAYTVSSPCNVTVLILATPVYADGSTGTTVWAGLGSAVSGRGSGMCQCPMEYSDIESVRPEGWSYDLYLVRTCDNTVIGYTTTYMADNRIQ
jgi:hypothetical protein